MSQAPALLPKKLNRNTLFCQLFHFILLSLSLSPYLRIYLCVSWALHLGLLQHLSCAAWALGHTLWPRAPFDSSCFSSAVTCLTGVFWSILWELSVQSSSSFIDGHWAERPGSRAWGWAVMLALDKAAQWRCEQCRLETGLLFQLDGLGVAAASWACWRVGWEEVAGEGWRGLQIDICRRV